MPSLKKVSNNTGPAPLKLCLFFSYGISLKKWDELGILDREILLYKKFAESGVGVTFFTYGDRSDLLYCERLPGIKIIPAYAKKNAPKNPKICFIHSFLIAFKFRREFARHDILKTNQMWGAWIALMAKWLTGKKLIIRCGYEHYYTLLSEGWPKFERRVFYLFSYVAYHASDAIIVTANNIADFVINKFFLQPGKVSVFPNLIDTELFKPESIGLPGTDRAVFVGRLTKEKNLFSLIQAAQKSAIGLDIIGDGPLRGSLEREAGRLNADIRFLGVIPNNKLPRVLAKYKLFILPSLYEGNPKALLEAMSCAKAVVGSNIPGIRDIIKDKKNGILSGTSVDNIYESIRVIKDDSLMQKTLGQKARSCILDNFSIDKLICNELYLYRHILSRKAKINEGII